LKITYTVWMDEHCHQTVQRVIDSWDYRGVLADIEDVIELRHLRAENHRLRLAAQEKP
jgi:hypothetical protein